MNQHVQTRENDNYSYFGGAIGGLVLGGMIAHSVATSGAPFMLMIPIVLMGGLMTWSAAMAGSVGGGDGMTFAMAGFGIGLMISPLLYGMGKTWLEMVWTLIEMRGEMA